MPEVPPSFIRPLALAEGQQRELKLKEGLSLDKSNPISGVPFKVNLDKPKEPDEPKATPQTPKEKTLSIPRERGDPSRLTKVKDEETIKAEEEMLQEKLKQIDRDVFKAMRQMVKELPKELERRQANKEKT